MTVTMTSEALGKVPGEDYTGPEEGWLLAQGYAKQAGYTGVGVSNTGTTDVAPDADLTLASNRENANDPERQAQGKQGAVEGYNYDQGGVDNDPAVVYELEPNSGPAGTTVTVYGDGLEDVSAVTFGGVAATNLEKTGDNEFSVVTGAHAAGLVDVVVTDANGSTTKTGAYTYA